MFRTAFSSTLLLGFSLMAHAATLNADFTAASHIPVTASSYTATGNDVTISLSHTPSPGTMLTIVKNTGLDFITGEFSNLAHGQTVSLSYGGKSYDYLVNYYGGDGNDLVLQWGMVEIYNTNQFYSEPTLMPINGALVGRKILSSSYNMALCNDGRIITWGDNNSGQLGNGNNNNSAVPVLVDNNGALAGKKVAAISSNGALRVALCSDGSVVAWGTNSSGELGNGTTSNSNVPVAVNFSPNFNSKRVARISASGSNVLALCTDNTLLTWGSGFRGQMGNGTIVDINSLPKQVTQTGVLLGKTISQIAAAGEYSYAVCTDGSIASWGDGSYGALGDGNSYHSIVSTPILVKSNGALAGKTVSRIQTGGFHNTIAICFDNTLVAWGKNGFGELAIGDIGITYEPTRVIRNTFLNGKNVTSFLLSRENSFFVCDDATIGFSGLDTVSFNFATSPVQSSYVNFPATSEIIELQESHLLIARNKTSDANLSNITLSAGSLAPAFDENTTLYSVSVPNTTATINLTPTASDSNAVIRVDGSVIGSTQAYAKTLVVGANPVVFEVTAEDGTTKSYTVTINRTPSSIATLSSLGNTARPFAFNSNTFTYTPPSIASTIDQTIITPTSTHPNATITINGTPIASGASSAPIPLAFGQNSIVVVCTAADGVTQRTYTINLNRSLSTVSTLSALSISNGQLSPAFAPSNVGVNHAVTVPHSTTEFSVTPTLTDANATVQVNGVAVPNNSPSQAIALNVGENLITIRGYAQQTPLSTTYRITVTRLGSPDATLASIVPSAGSLSPAFSAGQTSYSIQVPSHQSSIFFQQNTTEPNASCMLNGSPLSRNTNSPALPLVTGPNVFDFIVTAQDPTSTLTYRVTVNRAPASDATLTNLTSNRSPLTPTFSRGVLEYSCTVDSSTPTIQLTPTKAHVAATITVNGTPVSSGVASGNINLLMGRNEITVRVTAEDATTTTDYKVFVTRTPALDAISFSEGTITPAFSGQGLTYTLPITSGASSLRVTPTSSHQEISILVNGVAVTSGTASSSFPMENLLPITVSAIGLGGVRTDYLIMAQDARDPDADGLTNYAELQIYQTNPTLADTDGDGINDGAEVRAGLNPKSIDSDNDGMPDNLETATGGTNTPTPRISDAVSYDFSQLMASGNTMKLLGRLPGGLKLDSSTGKITGVITGKPGVYSFSLLIMNGRTILQTIPVTIPVLPYPLALVGTFQAMLHDGSGQAIGMLSCTVSAPGKFSATLNRSGASGTLKAKGVFTLVPGENQVQFLLNFPDHAVYINLDTENPAVTGTHSQGVVRGYRLATGSELPVSSEKSTMVFDHGTYDGISAPAGLGSATMSLQANGTATLLGQTGDAKAFTAKANLAGTGQIMLWVNPYKEINSYFGGVLQARAGSALLNNQMVWKKAPITGDSSYPQGFGPFTFPVMAMSYQTPTSAQALLNLWSASTPLPLAVDGAGLPSQANIMPTSLSLAADFKLSNANQPAWAMQIASSTGGIKGNMTWTASGSIASGRSNILGVITPGQPSLFAAGLLVVPQSQPKGSYRTAVWSMKLAE